MALTDKEIDTKLTKHGLPMWGTQEEKFERLVRNGLHAAEVKSVEGLHKNPIVLTEIAAEGNKMEQIIETHGVTPEAPRKLGRPKKVK